MATVTITQDNFDSLALAPGKTVLLDFWAPWCAPCKMQAPVLEALAQELPDVTIGKINIDEQPALAQRFAIQSIPTLVILKDGRFQQSLVGVTGKAELHAALTL